MTTDPALGVGLLGLGTVNGAVARRLLGAPADIARVAERPVRLAGVVVRSPARHAGVDLGGAVLGDDADQLVTAASVDVIVEAIGGVEPARTYIEAALRNGKHVVTANKAVMAIHGPALSAIAREHGVSLRHGAAVGGAVPVLEMLGHGLRGDDIRSIDCICNGTTNFILGRMSRDRVAYAAALREAQDLGYAEADPSFDIDGGDAASKLALLAAQIWGGHVPPEAVRCTGIGAVHAADIARAEEMGCVVKLLARAQWDGQALALSVQPTLLVRGRHALADIDGSGNGFLVQAALSGTTLITGTGAGGEPTASAVINDIVGIARDGARGWHPLAATPLPVASAEDAECAAYLRVRVNSSGAVDEVAQMLEDRGVSVATLIDTGPGDIVVLTGATPVAVIDRALETIDTLASVDRIESRLEMSGHL